MHTIAKQMINMNILCVNMALMGNGNTLKLCRISGDLSVKTLKHQQANFFSLKDDSILYSTKRFMGLRIQ